MEFRQLEYLSAVAETGRFSKAAERCFVSQSAISHQIAALERELEVVLFDRSTRRVELTQAGEILLPRARELLRLRDDAVAAVRPQPDRVRIAANMSFANAALTAVSAIRDRHPAAEIDFLIKPFAQRIDAVATGEADLALIRGRLEFDGLYLDPLWIEQPVVAFSPRHPLSKLGRPPTPAELAHYPLILPPVETQRLLHNLVDRVFAKAGVTAVLGPEIREGHPVSFALINNTESWTLLYDDLKQPGIICRRNPAFTLTVSAALRVDAAPNPLVADLLTELSGGYR
ncbi:LysR family transcriptional regulator [Gordonia hydrophobica]|uniref:LysR family transcriptional regulator n=1 Tax=Gordonia hydrophobica TaxID=40516 RepID=A0ABZ2U1B4_9ACTN|nr:LysR family transcriptional regulator [Gordonia hydrophobica]MBM7368552.1 DNA-binding transcriptional LysR family regulator [Gordonia hydrophobica]